MGPLEGIKVLELATVVAAPTAARVMCDYGAEVIKIETLSGDEMRRVGEQEKVVCEDYKNPLFTATNSNKKLISVNIKTEEGKEAIFKLLETSDVFLSNVRAASLARMGLDYETLKKRFPKLIYAHFSGYGPEGPAANYPGFDSTAFWLRSGPIHNWRQKDAFPFTPTYAFGDIATSSAFLSGILMALIGRDKTGHGTMVRTSLFASGVWCNTNAVISSQPQFGKVQVLDPMRPVDPFSSYYLCSDGRYIGFYCNEYERDKEKFAKIFGIEDILVNPNYDSITSLQETGALEEAVARLNQIFLTKTSTEWNEIFIENNVSNEIARDTKDVHCDEQAVANGYVEEVKFADDVKAMMPTPPMQFSEYTRRLGKPTGKVGENTDEVFAELGYSQEEIQAMRDKGAIY